MDREYLGNCLSVAQRLGIRATLNKLRINEDNPNINFWGKISGSSKDYFIAIGVRANESINKVYYFSSDEGLNFAKLPTVDDFVREKAKKVRGLFTGNPSFIYKDPTAPVGGEEEEEEEEGEENEEKPMDPSKRKLNELERLSYTVESIDYDTCIVPRGAYFLSPTGNIKKNSAFEGLNSGLASESRHYLLFRDPVSSTTLNQIRKVGVSNNFDFLDPVTDCHPNGALIVHVDSSGTAASLRSLVWPGYEFKLEVNSANYGGAYYGHGQKNDDVLFML